MKNVDALMFFLRDNYDQLQAIVIQLQMNVDYFGCFSSNGLIGDKSVPSRAMLVVSERDC